MRLTVLVIALLAGACGGEPIAADGGYEPNVADAASAADATDAAGPCFPGVSNLQPFSVGFSWTYHVTVPGVGWHEITRRFTREIELRGESALEFETVGPAGRTLDLMRRDGTAVVRLQREIRDATDAILLTSTYEPPALWIDEAPERTTQDATWDENYVRTDTDQFGGVTSIAVTERWLVDRQGDLCVGSIGDSSCLWINRDRIAGDGYDVQLAFRAGLGLYEQYGGGSREALASCSQ